jgi:hypothetical protein
MPERTHPSQADEGLRRITVPKEDVRKTLQAIAERLTDVRPDGPMREPLRMALALRFSHAHYGVGEAAEDLERAVLRLMPRIDRPITRGEYGLLLHRAART